MYNKILLPTDGSKASYDAAKHAIWEAKSCNAELIVLNVVESSKLPEMVPVEVEASLKKMLMEEGNMALEGVSELLDKSLKEINVSYIIKEGSPATIILQTIENNNIDLVVMGTSGKHRLDRLFMGSVAEKVVRNAKCAVTIIH
jgi:nucleotide-binding universal stress UspA family protein